MDHTKQSWYTKTASEMTDDEEDMPCGEGMCQCHCDGGHVCGCDCWRCDQCMQSEENCDCDID